MVESFDFLFLLQRNVEFRKKIEDAMHGTDITELFCYRTKLTVCPKEELIYIDKRSEDAWKVLPATITFNAVNHVLAENWDFPPEEMRVIF